MLVRQVLGDQLRRHRLAQQRTLRQVSREARVSLGYLSEVERGRKEASSELLGSICAALDVPLSSMLRDVSDDLALQELLAGATPTVRTLPRQSPLPAEPLRDAGAGDARGGDPAVVVDLAA
jgi:transcriptional regulator with XRE-family HTH domain